LLTQVATTGFTANGFTVTAAFIIGGGFSTDGVHLLLEVRNDCKQIYSSH
jgi:hypothetical protein